MTLDDFKQKYTFTMNKEKQNMIATIVKEKRNDLKFTQQELADISNISLRSIQRIEKGEVNPRMHTLKSLSKCLDFSLDFLDCNDKSDVEKNEKSLFREVTISIFMIIATLLISTAFIFQSNTFPETDFEFCLYYFVIVSILSFVLALLWKHNRITIITSSNFKNI
ncbi:helix-turn-helix domain-containing protein [Gillisia marina]|uniref:helix-turn-helix domain-containing protein n=1 Tax=Gillisia marina TaxID=1167637 RepID=UPI00029A52FD|nr:helix-turn-helix transcriptional regulator [Gillisia marina]